VKWIGIGGGGAADNMSTGVVSVKNSGRHPLTRCQTHHHHHHLLILHHFSGELKSIFAPPFPCSQFQQHRRQHMQRILPQHQCAAERSSLCGTLSHRVLSSRLPFYGRKRPRRRLVDTERTPCKDMYMMWTRVDLMNNLF
jgi:hypothetical protein